jgi:hypothetical protein
MGLWQIRVQPDDGKQTEGVRQAESSKPKECIAIDN